MKKGMILPMLAIVLSMASCGAPKLIKQDEGWVYLGQSKANHIREKDVIKITSREKFSELRIFVFNKNVEIRDLEIMLINGDILKPVIDSKILASDRSRLIELSTDGKQLEKITIRYRSEGKLFTEKALIQVGGRKAGR